MTDQPTNGPKLKVCKKLSELTMVIPSYNYGCFLAECIQSILDQSVQPAGILVMDDGSTDNTAEVAASFGNAIDYRQCPHRGVAKTRNAALPLIQTEWYMNLDADNLLGSGFIEYLSEILSDNQENEKLGFIYPKRMFFGDEQREIIPPEFDPYTMQLGQGLDMNAVLRTRVVRKVGFDPAFAQGMADLDLFAGMIRRGWVGKRNLDLCVFYRVHSNSITANGYRSCIKYRQFKKLVHKYRKDADPALVRKVISVKKVKLISTVINQRSGEATFRQRLRECIYFFKINTFHPQAMTQLRYLIQPKTVCRIQEVAKEAAKDAAAVDENKSK